MDVEAPGLSLIDAREWLLHAALERMRAAAPWPAYVRTRHYRAIVLLSQRVGGLHVRGDPSPLLALGQHAVSLLASDEACVTVGLALAEALAVELNQSASGDRAPVGLSAAEHVWCHALIEVHVLPTLVPAVLHALRTAIEAGRAVPAAARAVAALLAWRFLPTLRGEAPATWPHSQLWAAVQSAPGALEDNAGVAPVPSALVPVYCSAELPVLLVQAARATQDAAASRALREALQSVAAFEPTGSALGAWPAQRAALVQKLDAAVAATSPADAAELQQLAETYAVLLDQRRSACVLIEGAIEPAALLEALARVTHACLAAAFDAAPRVADVEATAAADAALDAALGLWRTLLCALPGDVRDLHTCVRDHVVLPYQAGRLRAAALAADANDECGDEQTSDAELYDEQLTVYAALARDACPAEALGGLASALDTVLAAAATPTPAVWEQLHWVALLVGHVAADAAHGEAAYVPDTLVATPAAHAPLLHVLGQGMSVLGALAPAGPMSHTPASPQAVASLLWLVARWVPAYVLRESHSSALEAPLTDEAGAHVLDTLVHQLQTVAVAWRADEDVLGALAHVVVGLSRTPGAMRTLLASKAMLALVRDTLGALEVVPAAAQGPLLGAFVRCVDAAPAAAPERAVYYPLLVDAARARIEAACTARATADTAHAALSLLATLADAADPQASDVHAALLAQFPAAAHLAAAHAAHTDVLCAALTAATALVRALAELDGAALVRVSPAANALLTTVHAELSGSATPNEDLLVLYLRLTEELARAWGAVRAPGAGDEVVAPGDGAIVHEECAGAVAVMALARCAPLCVLEVVSVPRVREALADATCIVLQVCGALLLGASVAGGAAPLPSPVAVDERDMSANPIVPRGVDATNPLQIAVRLAIYLVGSADTYTEAAASAIVPALGGLAERSAHLQAGVMDAALTQHVIDAAAGDLLCLLLVRPLHRAVLTPVLLGLRTVLLARASDAALGGSASLVAALEAQCAAIDVAPHARETLAAAAAHIVQQVLHSRPAPAPPAASPALTARLRVKEEQAAAVALNRVLRPYIVQVRGTLVVY